MNYLNKYNNGFAFVSEVILRLFGIKWQAQSACGSISQGILQFVLCGIGRRNHGPRLNYSSSIHSE